MIRLLNDSEHQAVVGLHCIDLALIGVDLIIQVLIVLFVHCSHSRLSLLSFSIFFINRFEFKFLLVTIPVHQLPHFIH
jgi:hypothetical protein